MTQLKMDPQLELDRCPHCRIARPRLSQRWQGKTHNHAGKNLRVWTVYGCETCGGLVTCGGADSAGLRVDETFPSLATVDAARPERARHFLQQAHETVHAPSGAVVLAASAVDAMLKAKGKRDGSLYSRIDSAATQHLITPEMALWAHEVRLDANDQRHADEEAPLPSEAEAKRAIAFAAALGEFLFVLPAKVAAGRRGVSA